MGLFSRLLNRTPVDLDARAPETGVKYGDLLVLEQLVRAGADVTAPRHVIYYLYFQGADAAAAAAADSKAFGFDVSVRAPDAAGAEQWSVVCERHDYVLDLEIVRDNTDVFEAIAARHAGEYDGWEASAN